MTMRRPYQIAGSLFLLMAVLVGWQSLTMKFYTHLGPGPGFFPFWLAVALGVVSIVMIAQSTFGPSEPMPADFRPTRGGVLRMATVVVTLAATAALLEPLGFRLTMFAALLFLLAALGRQVWFVTVLIAAAGSFGAFQVFDGWLRVALPTGVFGL
ncbi:MAG: tripartite tricarboxylate transporter TctB family protein [Rhodoplanes sp.]|uniref:tripartite tricarboxylate transporter TctB family protein n=1 Tax=Rhodoplanes sp. TaxID=1968906 RepID=UPI0017D0890D|nr:tripartite tricarboxylate transporter TctB family protein [Rhodoplanes sp.]NVO12624.1 tripartite tricarboxylate transporter TctB family protein [Rhodoplanes sp.]